MDETKVIDLVREELKRRIEEKGTQKAVAEDLEISPMHLSDFMNGNRTFSEHVLDKLGFARVTVHVKHEQIPLLVKQVNKVLKERS